ncbi:hypothetical protein Q4583_04275 [Neptunomonas phycophila]|uniref:Ribosome alternative rescue factor ArfA n=1 Tax=Neptunomonas phycophila TaxID=1572645 RepID=A0AAW7XDW2_9GAMM|nr:hypothetical protein [Neptunomonas phycophila]MDO6452361.1 hypothetical protein [Neptunomonas phycophila]MDO6783320.1 hypothetical protein [Neptunomonas phycophila]
MNKTKNLVAKHAVNYQKSAVFKDKKKQLKRGGTRKHKGQQWPVLNGGMAAT